MKRLAILLILFSASQSFAFSYETGGCTNGCSTGEQWLASNANELANAMTDVEDSFPQILIDIDNLEAGTSITALDIDLITGDASDDDDLDVAAGGTGVSTLTDGGVLIGNAAGDIVATAVLTEGQLLIGDGTTDPAVATMSGDATIASTGALTITANSVALGTDTTGNYAGSSSEGGAATTATALAANGSNCTAGNFPLGVDASGAVESCTDVVLPAEVSAYTVGTSAPVDGSTACTEGDMLLDHTANKIYFCVDSATDDWFGVGLTDTP